MAISLQKQLANIHIQRYDVPRMTAFISVFGAHFSTKVPRLSYKTSHCVSDQESFGFHRLIQKKMKMLLTRIVLTTERGNPKHNLKKFLPTKVSQFTRPIAKYWGGERKKENED